MNELDTEHEKDPAKSRSKQQTVAGITAEEFLSTLSGTPSKETLAKIQAAMDDPNSQIHAFLRSFSNHFDRITNPDAVNWEASILPRDQRAQNPSAGKAEIGRG